MQSLTRGNRYLRVKYNRDPGIPPSVGFAPKRELDPPERFKKRLRDFWQSRVDETWRAEQERDEFRRLLRDYGLAQNPSEDAKKRLRLFYGVGVLDPREGYDTRLRNFYGVAGATASAEVSLP